LRLGGVVEGTMDDSGVGGRGNEEGREKRKGKKDK